MQHQLNQLDSSSNSKSETGDVSSDTELLDQMLEQPLKSHPKASPTPAGLVVGTVVALDETGLPVVSVPQFLDLPVVAQSLCEIEKLVVGKQCAVMFLNGRTESPVVVGAFQQPVLSLGEGASVEYSPDGKYVDITSEVEINLHCGDAHFRMTSDGLIEMRGRKVVSHSTGLNRIRGASVKLN